MIPNSIVKLLFLVFGTLRPGYETYLQFMNGGVKGCNEWVKYWIVYSVLVGLWSITDMLFFWLPLFEEIKLVIMIYLSIAPLAGSAILFDHLICPLMVRNEKALENIVNESKNPINVKVNMLRNLMIETFAWMQSTIPPSVITAIRMQLYPVLISEVSSVFMQPNHNEMNMAARVVDAETEIEESLFDEWEDALNTQLPEEQNDEAEPINQNRNIGHKNFMPITGKFNICELIQLVQYKEDIEDVKDETIYEEIVESPRC